MASKALTFALLSGISAALEVGGYGETSAVLNISVHTPAWQDAVARSNATGAVSLPGFNVSEPWPGTSLDGWTIKLTGVDLSRLPADLEAEGKRRVIGEDVRIVAPESLYVPSANASDGGRPVVDAHPDWLFCAWIWYLPPSGNASISNNPDNKSATPDGSCAPWVNDACITGLEKAARLAYEIRPDEGPSWGVRHRCLGIEVPSACGSGYMQSSSVLRDSQSSTEPVMLLRG